MLLILLGAPGSGKGTISKELATKECFEHISTGNIFRNLAKQQTEFANNMKKRLDSGLLIDNQTTWEIVLDSFKWINFEIEDIILDGFPRNIVQYKHISKYLIDNQIAYKFLYFKISDEEVIERLNNRLYCPLCNRTYNKLNLKPNREWYCDDDNTELLQRKDDQLDSIQRRLDIYKKDTYPIIELIKDKKFFIEISADKDFQKIYSNVKEKIFDV